MAEAISITMRVVVSGTNNWDSGSKRLTITPAAVGGPTPGYQIIGTTTESILFGDVVTPGYCMIENLDSTNFVQIGGNNGGSLVEFAKLKPGELALIPLDPLITMRAKADTAAVKVRVSCFER